jgi:ApbE superfamily uncharacterized protein (UPF0280 family)
MKIRPQIRFLADGRRLHMQDGPIDLILEATGSDADLHMAYDAATRRFSSVLDELCEELPFLRQVADPAQCVLKGRVARRMHAAVVPFAADHFITPMAAVAGAVAEEILDAMMKVAELQRAYVNNGGDIAFHLADGQSFRLGLADRPDQPGLIGATTIEACQPTRGVATSGCGGRSFSLGIADAVTVLAQTAAQADAAATVIANAVDLPGHPGIVRVPACDIQPDNDLGDRLVTRSVGQLLPREVATALEAGVDRARELLAAGLIDGAVLYLQDKTFVVMPKNIHTAALRLLPSPGLAIEKESLLNV